MNFTAVSAEEEESKDVSLEAQGLFQKQSGPGNYVPTPEECAAVSIEGVKSNRPDGYAALEGIDGPDTLLAMLDAGINSGIIEMHKWQLDVLETFRDPGFVPTQLQPLRYCLCACNGSGKDAFVIAPLVVWFALTRIRGRVIITSSSGAQLESQTENYIKSLAENTNKMLGRNIFRIRQRYIRCNLTGAEIRLFATDEPGKAEGYHPLEAGAEMMIVINEAKSIAEDIFQALTRCTGFNYWVEVSSPGEPKGHFHDVAWSTFKHKRRVTAFDCPHLGDEHIESNRLMYGENHPVYRSMILADFTSTSGQVVVTLEQYNKLMELREIPELILPGEYKERIGIDFACGGDGDSTYLVRCRNNKLLNIYRVKSSDLEEQIQEMHRKLNEWGAKKARITMDDKGVGKGPLRSLEKLGWAINRIRADMRALNNKEYGNRGAEIWFNIRRVVEQAQLDLWSFAQTDKDQANELRDQLTKRHYRTRAGKIVLFGKKEEKKEGIKSPDIADALCFAFSDLSVPDFAEAQEQKVEKEAKHMLNNFAELQAYMDSKVFGDAESEFTIPAPVETKPTNERCVFGSITALLNKQPATHSYGQPKLGYKIRI